MTKVLLVEDEPGLVMTLTDRLMAEGYDVESATDAPSGLEMAASGSFDAILLDVMLPGGNGMDVCRTLRQRGRTREGHELHPLFRADMLGPHVGLHAEDVFALSVGQSGGRRVETIHVLDADDGTTPGRSADVERTIVEVQNRMRG